jgi:hypothetical protein
MWVRAELMNGELIFNNLVGISSHPWEFFALHCGSLVTSNPAENRKLFSESWLRAGTLFRL